MEACVVICRTAKAKERRNKILFINAVNEVTRERAQSFLTDDHIARIVQAYEAFKDESGFTRVVGLEEIRAKDGNLNIPLYVSASDANGQVQISTNGSLSDALSAWLASASDLRAALTTIMGADALKEAHAIGGQPVQALPAWIKPHEWKHLPFGAFAQSVNERVEPSQAGDEIYVGLEHLDPQDLHIRRWGKGSDVIGTKLRFRKGDLIFGRRRAYQRKLAVAEFDGISSAHAMVVRARPDVVLPEFLPFLMISDCFMNRAVEISVGSLSPTINWSALKLEEFALPPLDQQRRIAEILWAVDECTVSLLKVAANLESLRQSVSDEALRGGSEKSRTNGTGQTALPQKRLEDIYERVSVGIVVTPSKYYQPTGVRCFRSANVRRGYINDKDWVFISEEAHRLHSKSILHAGDVLVVRSGVFAGMSCVVPAEYDLVNCIDVVFATPRREVVASEWLQQFPLSLRAQ